MVAALLRTNVAVPVLLADLAAIDTLEGIVLAVAVVLHGAAAEVADCFVGLVQAPCHSPGVHLPALVVASLQVLSHDELALRSEDIGHDEVGIHGIAVIRYDDRFALVVKFGAFHGCFVPARITPCGEGVLHPCAVVVVGGSAPEAGLYALAVFEHRLAVDVEVVDVTCPLVPGHAGAVGREGEPSLGLILLYGLGLLGQRFPLLINSGSRFGSGHDGIDVGE